MLTMWKNISSLQGAILFRKDYEVVAVPSVQAAH